MVYWCSYVYAYIPNKFGGMVTNSFYSYDLCIICSGHIQVLRAEALYGEIYGSSMSCCILSFLGGRGL